MRGCGAAISLGIIVAGEAVCDLEYIDDWVAETNINVVMFEDGRLIEVQVTAECKPVSTQEFIVLL